jgi:hypothetical protein
MVGLFCQGRANAQIVDLHDSETGYDTMRGAQKERVQPRVSEDILSRQTSAGTVMKAVKKNLLTTHKGEWETGGAAGRNRDPGPHSEVISMRAR